MEQLVSSFVGRISLTHLASLLDCLRPSLLASAFQQSLWKAFPLQAGAEASRLYLRLSGLRGGKVCGSDSIAQTKMNYLQFLR
jgi:hypothetical protein